MNIDAFEGLPAYPSAARAEIYACGRGLETHAESDNGLACEVGFTTEQLLTMLATLPVFGAEVATDTDAQGNIRARVSYCGHVAHIERKGRYIRVSSETPLGKTPCAVMQNYHDTEKEAFEEYLRRLQACPGANVYIKRAGRNVFAQTRLSDRLIYAYYIESLHTARIISDPISDDVPDALSENPEDVSAAVKPCLVQYSLTYGRMRPGMSADCGMLYILRLPDNSLFVIDGGEREQATDEALRDIYALMRELCRVKHNEKLVIAAWFCTHAHDDHMDVFSKLIRLYHDQMELERVIFNFPARERLELMPQSYIAALRIRRFYPNALYTKIHTGQEFSLAGVTFECLLTHEDVFSDDTDNLLNDFNDTSTVLRAVFDDVSVLFLGDINSTAAQKLMSMYPRQYLKCDAVQVAHHMFNYLPELYSYLSPAWALVPASAMDANPANPRYAAIVNAVPESNICFASEKTLIFESKNGRLAVAGERAHAGGKFDGSAV